MESIISNFSTIHDHLIKQKKAKKPKKGDKISNVEIFVAIIEEMKAQKEQIDPSKEEKVLNLEASLSLDFSSVQIKVEGKEISIPLKQTLDLE